jgi:tetratricopeptide (TPR) repeat protein
MNVLGCCYGELGMLDLAIRQLEEASREIVSMDETKKEIVYSLGLIYKRTGDVQKALACMKQIYEVDYGLSGCSPTRRKLVPAEYSLSLS